MENILKDGYTKSITFFFIIKVVIINFFIGKTKLMNLPLSLTPAYVAFLTMLGI